MVSTESKSVMTSTKKTASVITTSTGNSTVSTSSRVEQRSRQVYIGRGTFVVFLLVVAGLLGFLSYTLLDNAERNLVDQQYYSMTERALEATRTLATNKLQYGTRVMANVAGHAFPDASSWPFVWVDGYWDIVKNVIPTSCYTGLHLAPMVDPKKVNVSEFEDFVYGKYAEVFGPNQTMGANSDFGKGIWIMDSSIETVDHRLHDTTGVSIHGSPYAFLAPKVQHGLVDSPWIMMNVHGFERQGQALDIVVDCSKDRALAEDPTSINCQGLSLMNPPKDPDDKRGMFGFIATPIYPANDPTELVGFIFAVIFWNELMEGMYPGEVQGIDCVFSTDEESFTYTLEDGNGVYVGVGDLHDTKYNDYKMSTVVLDPETMAKKSNTYYCDCYPNDDFGEIYSDGVPLMASLGAIFIILFMSTLFFLYDRCVRKEFDARKELFDAKRQFVRFVSHEVRTPLNSVSMGLTLMKEEMAQSSGFKSAEKMEESDFSNKNSQVTSKGTPGTPREWFTLANEIQSNTQVAVDVLNDLLNYDKVEHGELTLDLSVIPIWKLIEQTVAEFKLPLGSKMINLSFQLPDLTQEVLDQKVVGDSIRLTQALRNLISNALKFTPEGGDIFIDAYWQPSPYEHKSREFLVKGHETIKAKRSGNLLVSVKDTGAGMTKDQLKELFGQGVQFNVNELQHGNGSGLGLYITKGIVNQHEGKLVCDSEGLGKGTTFTMKLPMYDLPKREVTQHGEDDQVDENFVDKKLRVLIVDDAVSNRKLLSRLLKNKGHTVDQAEDGDIAVDMVVESDQAYKPYDLVLMDYEMPTMTGPEAASEIRKRGSDVFIVGVTGNLLPEDIDYFRCSGADAVLPKPFKISELDNLIFEHAISGSIVVPSSNKEATVDTSATTAEDSSNTESS